MRLEREAPPGDRPYALVLGIAQDAGYPQAGCRLDCCRRAREDPRSAKHVACLALVDPVGGERWLIDATPDFGAQLSMLDDRAPRGDVPGLDGILLTHAHVGHYLGLAQLGTESIGARGVAVCALPRMASFLRDNQPWAGLISKGHIRLRPLEEDQPLAMSERLSAEAFIVPHRTAHSETAAFRIRGTTRQLTYMPDVDVLDELTVPIEDEIARSDHCLLDGTFYGLGELGHRDQEATPHPCVVDTLERLSALPARERAKVRFTHLNHTNPLLADGPERKQVGAAGCAVAGEGLVLAL